MNTEHNTPQIDTPAPSGAGLDIALIKRALKAISFQERVSLCDEIGVHFSCLEAVLNQPGSQQSSLTSSVFLQVVGLATMRYKSVAQMLATPAIGEADLLTLSSECKALENAVSVLDMLGRSAEADSLRPALARLRKAGIALLPSKEDDLRAFGLKECPTCGGSGWAGLNLECIVCDGTGEVEAPEGREVVGA